MTTYFAALLITIAPPPFEPAWVDPSTRWDVPAGHGPEIALGALLGGWLGDVHPAYLVAVAAIETGWTFNSRAEGDQGRSLGLCQIQLRTARQSLPWVEREDLLQPSTNLIVAGVHFGRLIRLYGRTRAAGYYGTGHDAPTTRGERAKWLLFRKLQRR